MATTKDTFGDQRLKKDAGDSVRGARDDADVDRVQQDGSALSAAERRRMLRQEWVQEVLPTPPKIPGFHCCWLSTTNSTLCSLSTSTSTGLSSLSTGLSTTNSNLTACRLPHRPV